MLGKDAVASSFAWLFSFFASWLVLFPPRVASYSHSCFPVLILLLFLHTTHPPSNEQPGPQTDFSEVVSLLVIKREGNRFSIAGRSGKEK